MGTLFEPILGGFPGMASYASSSFVSFGPPVDFDAGFTRPYSWQNGNAYVQDESSLYSDTPELSSSPSSCNSSRQSLFHPSPEVSFQGSLLGEPEPCILSMNPYIVDHETLGQDSQIWANRTVPEHPCWSQGYLPGDLSREPVFPSIAAKPVPPLSPQESTISSKAFQNAKIQASMYSTTSNQLSTNHWYSYPAARIPLLDSNRPYFKQSDFNASAQIPEKLGARCPNPDCGKVFKDLKAHMLTHAKERPEKCPLVTCDYHTKGFCRKYDKNRHTLTHYKGIIVCSFCPASVARVKKAFNRADVFKRHLTSVHGVEHTPPPTSRKNSNTRASTATNRPTGYRLDAKGVCSICSVHFPDAQDFYHHLDDCVIRSILHSVVSSTTDTSHGSKVESHASSTEPARKFCGDTEAWLVKRSDELPCKRRKDYPPSWGYPTKMKKRVVCAFDGTRRLWKNEMMLSSDYDMSIPWNGESYVTGLDGQTIKKTDAPLNQGWLKDEDEFLVWDGIASKDYSLGFVDPSLIPQYSASASVAYRVPAYLPVKPLQLPQKTLVDENPRTNFRHYREIPAKQTDIPPTSGGERSTTSKVLRRKQKFIFPSGHSLSSVSSGVRPPGPPLLKPALHAGQSSSAEDTKQPIACKKEDPELKKKDADQIRALSPLTRRNDLLKDCDKIESNDRGPKLPSVNTPGDNRGIVACSPETDVSNDVSDNESISDCSTEWGEDQNTSSPGSDVYRILEDFPSDHTEGEVNLLRPVLSPMKQALVDRIMAEFWMIVNQEWAANLTRCAGETPASSSPPGANSSLITGSSPQMANRKRQRDDEEDLPPEDNNGRTPKRPNSQSERPLPKIGVKFACPFRKHAPHRYDIYKHRSCALSHWETVARVKEHLYRRHRVPIQCKRCWQTFKSQGALDDHITVLDICPLQTGQTAEGLTADLEKRLKSRKKSSPDQTEEARWKEIYGMLFPNEVVPNPYFEPVQENAPQSPDTRELAEYEEYSRQELPRVFRSYLEDKVNNETQNLEEHIRSQLVSIVQDCQARMFSAYRSKVANKSSKPTPDGNAIDVCVTPPSWQVSAEETLHSSKDELKGVVASVYSAPTPQSTLQYVPDLGEIQALNVPSNNPENISFSDSAYSSNYTLTSQTSTIPSQVRESALTKPSDDLYCQLPLGDDSKGGDGQQDLSFGESYNITLDMSDPDYGWWANLEAER